MHEHMVIDIDEAVELTHMTEKITVIYPTYQAPIECLLWSTFSLLLRTKVKDSMEHFMVVINGPDQRTGDPSNQDQKQAFLEELRDLKWWRVQEPKDKRDMPISVLRAWSRIGHPEAVEMALPWVHTDTYLIMHDDIIIGKHDWTQELKEVFFNKPDVALAFGTPELLCANCDEAQFQGKALLRMPHLLCAFLVCKKKCFQKIGASWCGYHIDMSKTPFKLEDRVGDVNEFLKYHEKLGCLSKQSPPKTDSEYNYVSMEMGAWQLFNLIQNSYKIAKIHPEITHFGAMSWESEAGKTQRLKNHEPVVKKLEEEILSHPDYAPLYLKYLPEKYK